MSYLCSFSCLLKNSTTGRVDFLNVFSRSFMVFALSSERPDVFPRDVSRCIITFSGQAKYRTKSHGLTRCSKVLAWATVLGKPSTRNASPNQALSFISFSSTSTTCSVWSQICRCFVCLLFYLECHALRELGPVRTPRDSLESKPFKTFQQND